MNCQQFKERLDSYISDELLVETNHDVLHHLENCPACRQELSDRRNLRLKLRSAVKNAPDMQITPVFASQLQGKLRESALRPIWWETFSKNGSFLNLKTMSAVAACLLVIAVSAGVFLKYRSSSPENNSIAENQSNVSTPNLQPSESPMVQAVQIAWREITAFAVGDHENCALEFRLKENPITLDEAAKKYGEFNKDLDKAVIEPLHEVFPGRTSNEINLLEAHSCIFEGRRFAHVVLSRQNHIISVLVTDFTPPGEFTDAIVDQPTGNLRTARFNTKHHAVFVVSNLSATENLLIAKTINSNLRQHIEKFEV
jgi:hypothetical protein